MPYTPLHMGPGIFIKALLQGSFSLMVFGWAQIIMDLQPLWVIIQGHGHMHGFSHTFVGSALLAIFSALSGKYLAQFGLNLIQQARSRPLIAISWPVAFASAYIGCVSHVLLDAIMHKDLQPWYPFSLKNPFLGWVTFFEVLKYCVYAGVAGTLLFFMRRWWSLRKAAP